ncbi:Dicer-like protein 2, partial [Cryomyces antarcticus]
MARKDAAFQAFVALHRAGLVNDNLLPLLRQQEDIPAMNPKDGGPTRVSVAERVDPWILVAQEHRDPKLWFKTLITLKAKDEEITSMVMLLPYAIADQSDFTLYWNANVEYTVHTKLLDELESPSTNCEDIVAAKDITHLVLWSVYRSRMLENRRDYPALFVPYRPGVALRIWADQMRGSRPAEDIRSTGSSLHSPSLVYEYGRNGSPQVFAGFDQITVSNHELQSDVAVPQLRVMSLTKRRNFLHRMPMSGQHRTDSQSTLRSIPASSASIGNLPFCYSLFALFVPSILHRYELLMLVDGLCNSILSPIGICNRRLVLTALTASSVGEGTDYQSLEFLGDCILKLCTAVQLAAQHRNWPESYLTTEKSRTNANSYLAKAALRTGLDRYIITQGLTGVKWRPRYNDEILAPRKESRTLRSTKVLADVVEALIGASFVDGGFEKAHMCIGVFLPNEQWAPLENNRTTLFDAVLPNVLPVTHASYNADSTSLSYQRLKFIGDAVLDFLIVRRLFVYTPSLSNAQMHLIRTALVNADFLAFCCMESTIDVTRIDITPTDSSMTTFAPLTHTVPRSLWQFMRYDFSSNNITGLQRAAQTRHATHRTAILYALQHDAVHPWALLTRMRYDKFFSDLVESVIGALYIDAGLDACEQFLQRLPLFPYMLRVLKEGVDCLHPKQRLGMLAGTKKIR